MVIPKEFLTKFPYNPLKRLNSWKEKAWILLPFSLDFFSLFLGNSFPNLWKRFNIAPK